MNDSIIPEGYISPSEKVLNKRIEDINEINDVLYSIQCSIPVTVLEDLLWKYEEYDLEVRENVVIVYGTIPMKRFITLKQDIKKLGYKELVVI